MIPKVKVKVKSLSCVRLFATPWTVAYQAPLSMGYSRQEYWNGFPFPSPGDLPNPGIEPRSATLQADALPSEPPGIPKKYLNNKNHICNWSLYCIVKSSTLFFVLGILLQVPKIIDIPKIYGKHRLNSEPSNHQRICKLLCYFLLFL